MGGNNVDDAANRLRSVERALRPTQHLDALDSFRQQITEIELTAGNGIAHLDAVDQHQGMIGLGPAQTHLCLCAQLAGSVDRHAGKFA